MPPRAGEDAYRAGQYLLPNDDMEQERLDMTHHVFALTLNGDICVTQLHNPQAILDIGTGTGMVPPNVHFDDSFSVLPESDSVYHRRRVQAVTFMQQKGIKDNISPLLLLFTVYSHIRHKSSAPFTMKTNFLTIAALAFATISGAAANLAGLPMGVEITERDGMTLVREVSHEHPGVEKRCREYVHLGGRCTIGDGSCTCCGNHCKSICVPDGETCEKWCL
ncbi:Uncharacterized protein TPAR_03005 [Tolypocladium paradoxum]|uniref:Uncharacterized protein n=1 Tax=Tolypocladium paradoxum TaxID=94208 RepID=A0A2S4L2Y6_9HYPO|nr:Uncharacterized protein TPAR_03005 [Tolypocladium paradoxum]